jgi:hypothetical protein
MFQIDGDAGLADVNALASDRFAPQAAGRQFRLAGAKLFIRHESCARDAETLKSG